MFQSSGMTTTGSKLALGGLVSQSCQLACQITPAGSGARQCPEADSDGGGAVVARDKRPQLGDLGDAGVEAWMAKGDAREPLWGATVLGWRALENSATVLSSPVPQSLAAPALLVGKWVDSPIAAMWGLASHLWVRIRGALGTSRGHQGQGAFLGSPRPLDTWTSRRARVPPRQWLRACTWLPPPRGAWLTAIPDKGPACPRAPLLPAAQWCLPETDGELLGLARFPGPDGVAEDFGLTPAVRCGLKVFEQVAVQPRCPRPCHSCQSSSGPLGRPWPRAFSRWSREGMVVPSSPGPLTAAESRRQAFLQCRLFLADTWRWGRESSTRTQHQSMGQGTAAVAGSSWSLGA